MAQGRSGLNCLPKMSLGMVSPTIPGRLIAFTMVGFKPSVLDEFDATANISPGLRPQVGEIHLPRARQRQAGRPVTDNYPGRSTGVIAAG
jgi:hypothetical protein